MAISGCSSAPVAQESITTELPKPNPNMENDFHVDQNINMGTIDEWLHRTDVEYRDMRMVQDPANYDEIGGDSSLSMVLEGFKVVPYPYIGTVPSLPVSGAYEGKRLFEVEWDGTHVVSVRPNFEESQQIVEEVFPKDKPIFFMCGGGGYAFATIEVLSYLGWNRSNLYNVGGMWDYTGYKSVEIARTLDGKESMQLWRADIVTLGMEYLHALS